MSPSPVEIEHDIEDKPGGHHDGQPAIELIDQKDDPGVRIARDDVKSPASDVLSRVGMALAAGLRQIQWVDGGARITTGQNSMIIVATDAVGALEDPKLDSDAMKAPLERLDLFDGDAAPFHNLDVGVTTSAGISDILRVERGAGIVGRKEIVLAMAIGADGRLQDIIA